MGVTRPHSPVKILAKRLTDDIHAKGLGPGDRYMTAAEVGQRYGVSRTAAHQAMRQMADEKLLVRRRNHGTFVGPHFRSNPAVRVRTIQVMVPADRDPGFSFDEIVEGLHRVKPSITVQFDFLPVGQPLSVVKQLVGQGTDNNGLFGAIVMSGTHEVYRWLEDNHIPTGVLGSVTADLTRLVSVDADWRESGRLLAEYLIGRGHRRLAMLLFKRWRPGDNLYFEGVTSAMTAAGLPPDGLVIRSLPADSQAAAAEVRALLETDNPPTGFFSWNPIYHDVLQRVCRAMGPSVSGNLEVVIASPSDRIADGLDVTCCCPKVGATEMVEMVTRMLADVVDGKQVEDRRVVIPVVLHETSGGSAPPRPVP